MPDFWLEPLYKWQCPLLSCVLSIVGGSRFAVSLNHQQDSFIEMQRAQKISREITEIHSPEVEELFRFAEGEGVLHSENHGNSCGS